MEIAPGVMTPDQVAEYLQLDRETIYRYIRDGKLAASRLGRTYRVQKVDVDGLLAQTRTSQGFVPREYTDEEIAEFLKNDEIDEEAREILRQFAAKFR